MDACCEPQGYDRVFTGRQARLDAARYRKSGLTWDPQRVVDLYRDGTIGGDSVLDVGAGIGDLGLELLRAGMGEATSVDMSPGYDAAAASLLAEAGLGERSRRVIGDVAAHPELAGPADVVTLMKVVCCYADAGRLLAVAGGLARRHVVLRYPRDAWWLRAGARGMALVGRWRRSDWRFHIHPERELLGALEAQGFSVTRTERGGVWRLAVLQRG
ncbi:MAG: methyltransferase domain-containing protein [Promicromonosporaceae bacterium]|nr:methyltransferase domain-containing protein [Promicromonosporaceae bacterium]